MIHLHGHGFEGKTLFPIRRAPLFLRVVSSMVEGAVVSLDALDQRDDKPELGELVSVFIRVSNAGWGHVRPGGRFMIAHYWIFMPAPNRKLRDREDWERFVNEQMGLPADFDGVTTPDDYEYPPELRAWIADHEKKMKRLNAKKPKRLF